MTYYESLQTREWQLYREDIWNRDNHTCRKCDGTSDQLHTHHTYYKFGLLAYEYPKESVVTYCATCHFRETLMDLFDKRDLINGEVKQLGMAFGNCRGNEGKLHLVVDTIWRMSTLTIKQIQLLNVLACEEAGTNV